MWTGLATREVGNCRVTSPTLTVPGLHYDQGRRGSLIPIARMLSTESEEEHSRPGMKAGLFFRAQNIGILL